MPFAFLRRLSRRGRALPPPGPARFVDCVRCGCDFVSPVAWHERNDTSWWIRVRCGACGFVRELELSDEEAARFEREVDRGTAEIAATLRRLEREGRDGPQSLASMRFRSSR